MDKHNESLATGLGCRFFLKSLLAILLVVLSLFSTVSFAIAADGDYYITLSQLQANGSITWNGNDYPIYVVTIDGTQHKSICVTPNEKIPVDGKNKTFPSIMFFADEDDRGQSWGTATTLPYDVDNNFFSGAKSYYTSHKENVTLPKDFSETGKQMLLFRLPYGIGTKRNPYVTHAFLLIAWSGNSDEIDKGELNAAIAKAPKAANEDTVYWHENDKWRCKVL